MGLLGNFTLHTCLTIWILESVFLRVGAALEFRVFQVLDKCSATLILVGQPSFSPHEALQAL